MWSLGRGASWSISTGRAAKRYKDPASSIWHPERAFLILSFSRTGAHIQLYPTADGYPDATGRRDSIPRRADASAINRVLGTANPLMTSRAADSTGDPHARSVND